jgi:hypothetical protein
MAKKAKFALKVAILVVLIGAGSAWADLADGLVAHWQFEEGSGTTVSDSSGNSHNGTFVGNPQWVTGEIGNYALDFDGDDYIDLDDVLNGQSATTLTAWFYARSLSGSKMIQLIGEGGDQYGYSLGVNNGTGNLYFGVVNSETEYVARYSNSNINLNEWNHLAGVYDGSTGVVRLYLNGSEVASATAPAAVGNAAQEASIAYDDGVGSMIGYEKDYFDGRIDDVLIYNRALTGGQIRQLCGIELESLEITGPDEVAESSQAQYKATAVYDNSDTEDVTDSVDCVWSVEPNNNCGIAAGLLTTEMVDLPTDVTITAQYTEGENIQEAQKDVSILPICPSGSALEFDGQDDYIDLGSGGLLSGYDSFTISAWINANDSAKRKTIYSEGNSGNIFPHITFRILRPSDISSKELQLIVRDNNADSSSITWSTPFPSGWHHVVGIRNGSDVKLYIDSVGKTATGNVAGPLSVNGVAIGRSKVTSYTEFFDGIIDEVAIYNRALSAEDVQKIMYRKLTGDEPGLVGYWDFDEGQGQVVYDSSGNENNGTVLGAAWTDSIAPVGICTNRELMEQNFSDVFDIKASILEQLENALSKEHAIEYLLGECIADGEFSEIKKSDLAKAEHDLSTAVRKENRAKTSVDESIDNLNDALESLDIELPVED